MSSNYDHVAPHDQSRNIAAGQVSGARGEGAGPTATGGSPPLDLSEPEAPWWPSFLSAVLTGIVAFWGMGGPQFWFDETATISAVQRPLSSLVELLGDVDAVHGLYYLLMYPWAAIFGTSEVAMRTPSALALMVTTFVLTRIGMNYARRFTPHRVVFVGLLTGVIVSVLPGLSWTGQDARGYAFSAMSVTLAWWCFERFAITHRAWLVVGFTVAMAAAAGFSLYALFTLPVFFARTLRWGRKAIVQFFVACAAVGVACLPLAYIGSLQSEQVSWINLSVRQVLYAMAYRVFFISPRNHRGEYVELTLSIAPYLAILAVGVVLLGLALSKARWMMVWIGCLVFFPFAVVVVAQLAGGQYFQERYLAFTGPAASLLIALGLAAVPWRAVGVVLAAVFAGLSFPSLLAQNGPYAKDDAYGTAASEAERADTVILMNEQHRGIFIAYPPDEAVADPMLVADPAESATLWGENQPVSHALELEPTGSVAVVSYHGDPDFPRVNRHLLGLGCTKTDNSTETRFVITNYACPAGA